MYAFPCLLRPQVHVVTRYQLLMLVGQLSFEPRHEKTNILVSELVRHKPCCTATEDGKRLEISDLESRGIVLAMKRKQRRRSASRLPRS